MKSMIISNVLVTSLTLVLLVAMANMVKRK